MRPVVALVRICVLALLLSTALGCHRDPRALGPPPARAFYYWRTTFELSPAELRAITQLHVARLYVRMFDVDETGELVGPLRVSASAVASLPSDIQIVPVVFLRQEVFRHPPADLAARIAAELATRLAPFHRTPHEVQLDCDWTDLTRDPFFAFLGALRGELPQLTTSATIRLHQIKYRERTGVPPVDRGMLMFYNMGTIEAGAGTRAIFDAGAAQQYLARIGEYPLPLDVALPLWSWVVHVRDGSVVGLMQNTDPSELPALDFLAPRGPDFVVTRTTFLHGEQLSEGDVLQPEVTTANDTLAAAALVAPHLPTAARTLALFDLSERNLARHDTRALDALFAAVR